VVFQKNPLVAEGYFPGCPFFHFEFSPLKKSQGCTIEGFEKGKKEEKLEMARKMMKKGEPPEKISEYTGISRKEIEDLV